MLKRASSTGFDSNIRRQIADALIGRSVIKPTKIHRVHFTVRRHRRSPTRTHTRFFNYILTSKTLNCSQFVIKMSDFSLELKKTKSIMSYYSWYRGWSIEAKKNGFTNSSERLDRIETERIEWFILYERCSAQAVRPFRIVLVHHFPWAVPNFYGAFFVSSY